MNKQVLVGIGASAGGLEALTLFLKELRFGVGCSFLVLQHLSPTGKSMLTEILSRHTLLPIKTAEHNMVLEPDNIYIAPQNCDVLIEGNVIILEPPINPIGPKPNINRTFQSMVVSPHIFPVGIILSGTGTDGTTGMQAINSSGGLTLVQDPTSAKYNGMPNSCVNAQCADEILTPKEMASKLIELIQKKVSGATGNDETHKEYYQIINLVKKKSLVDLTHYKHSTVERRIRKRMQHNACHSMKQYIRFLEQNDEEINTLLHSALIPVTEFMRDPQCFDRLAEILGSYFEKMGPTSIFRIWSPGCSTGEEAYSLAMLIENINYKRQLPIRYKIFATDLDEEVITVARRGTYQEKDIVNLSENMLHKYFERHENSYVVIKSIRNNITFSKHNLVQEPPFSRINLISCRNLLIYFNQTLQNQSYEIFHYSLVNDGILFLGKSENINNNPLFNELDRENHIFIKSNANRLRVPGGQIRMMEPRNQPTKAELKKEMLKSKFNEIELLAYQSVLEHCFSAMFVVDKTDTLIYVSPKGKSFLEFQQTIPNLVIYDLIIKPLKLDLKANLLKARRDNKSILSNPHKITWQNKEILIKLHIYPTNDRFDENLVILLDEKFELATKSKTEDDRDLDNNIMIQELQNELTGTQESLQTIIQELETTNEELQASNEESQSTNEELQSTNEELQTTNEELQSANEELLTVNDEIFQKNIQLEKLNSEFNILYQHSGLLYFILDQNMEIIALHKQLSDIPEFSAYKPNTNFKSLMWPDKNIDMIEHINEVITKKISIQFNLSIDGKYYTIDVRPYYRKVGQIAGVTFCLFDNTLLKHKQDELKSVNDELTYFKSGPDVTVFLDNALQVKKCSHGLLKILGYGANEILSKTLFFLIEPNEELIENHNFFHPKDLERNRTEDGRMRFLAKHKNGDLVPIEIHVRTVESGLIMCRIQEIIEIINNEKILQKQEFITRQLLDSIDTIVVRVDDNWKIVYANTAAMNLFLQDDYVNQPIGNLLNFYINEAPVTYTEELLESKNPCIVDLERNKVKYIFELQIYSVKDLNSSNDKVIVCQDVTEREAIAKIIKWESEHDLLTGMSNRKKLMNRLEDLIELYKQYPNNIHGLLFLDLDQFKIINDSVGHHAGDLLLKQLSNELLGIIRKYDLLARLGGDEFVLLLENCPLSRATHIANNVIKFFDDFRFNWEGKLFRLGVSIGICMLDTLDLTADKWINQADHACYMAKIAGRNKVAVYNTNVSHEHASELTQIEKINSALDNNLFFLEVQEIKPLNTSRGYTSYWEVLIRMRSNGGVLYPGAFLPIAERYNQVHLIDRWVVSYLAKKLTALVDKKERTDLPMLAINLSAQTLSHDMYIAKILSDLEKCGVPLTKFCFEVTETVAITNYSVVKNNLAKIHAKGCQIAIDDFGSGMASFGYLRELPLDIIKIDGSIIKDIETDILDLTIVQSIHQVSQVMDCVNVAEHVETQSIMQTLQTIGIDYIQGSYINKSIDFDSWLDKF